MKTSKHYTRQEEFTNNTKEENAVDNASMKKEIKNQEKYYNLSKLVEKLKKSEDPKRKYEYILWLGKKLREPDRKILVEKNKVKGCVSEVFVKADSKGGKLFWEGLRLQKEMMPTHAIVENVRNLLSIDNGNTIRLILKEISKLGYAVTMDVVNTKDFGVPQNRDRLFILCKRIEDAS